jgi:hypothetical protein
MSQLNFEPLNSAKITLKAFAQSEGISPFHGCSSPQTVAHGTPFFNNQQRSRI